MAKVFFSIIYFQLNDPQLPPVLPKIYVGVKTTNLMAQTGLPELKSDGGLNLQEDYFVVFKIKPSIWIIIPILLITATYGNHFILS